MAIGDSGRLRVQFNAISPKKLGPLLTPQLADHLVLAVLGYADEVIDRVRKYPPIPPTSRYQRTQTYFDSWTRRPVRSHDAIAIRINSDAVDKYGSHYSGLVGGDPQWPIHAQHGWKGLQTTIYQMGGHERVRRITQAIITRETANAIQ